MSLPGSPRQPVAGETGRVDAEDVPVVVVGAGQAGLATGYHLRRAGLAAHDDYVLLDREERPGGAWPEGWDGLRLFSPAEHSSLPGRPMPPTTDGSPTARHVAAYLAEHERRYDLPVRRPVTVTGVERVDEGAALLVRTDAGDLRAQAVVSATGTWRRPFWPAYPGARDFGGTQLHASAYRRPEPFAGLRVVVVGGGNTAAQVLAEVSTVAETRWVTLREPRLMPDDVDGRALFAAATRRVRGDDPGVGGLGDVVVVPSVREARERGALRREPMFDRLVPGGVAWDDGRTEAADVVIWCTGFRPVLDHLRPLRLRDRHGHVATDPQHPTQSRAEPRLHLVGYGDWTGAASATLVGVGRTARDAVAQLVTTLRR